MKKNSPTEVKLTDKTVRALTILREHGPMAAYDFGSEMWPDHIGHDQVVKQGRGATRGKKIWRMAGGYLGRLNKKGLVLYVFKARTWRISQSALGVLAEYEEREGRLVRARANGEHPVRRDATRNKAFVSAWEKGWLAWFSGVSRDASPYPDLRGGKYDSMITFSRAFWRYWIAGWDAAEKEF